MYKLEKDKVLNSVLLERHSIVSVVLEKNINKNNKILDQEMEIVILKEELSLKKNLLWNNTCVNGAIKN